MKNELVIKEKTELNPSSRGKSAKKIILTILLFILIFGIGSGAGYFYGKKKQKALDTPPAQVEGATDQSQPTEQIQDSAQADTNFTDYTVLDGDTLFKIGLKFNMPWTQIAKDNNLSENSVIKTGMILKIANPNSSTSTGTEKTFTIDQTLAQQNQDKVNQNQETWLLDPVSVAKKDANGVFGITDTDSFNLKSKNITSGEAIVEITHSADIYQATLTQPVDKGPNGIWAVKTIKKI
jgi:hypothetical protein